MAEAQRRFRERKMHAGQIAITVWLSPNAVAYLEEVKISHHCDNQGDALSLVLESARLGKPLPNAQQCAAKDSPVPPSESGGSV